MRKPLQQKHNTSNSHQMPDKTSKDHQETIRAICRSFWLSHMYKSPFLCKQRFTWFLFTVYMHIVGTGQQVLLALLDCVSRANAVARASVIVPPSITRVFSETIKRINTNFYGKVALRHISRLFSVF